MVEIKGLKKSVVMIQPSKDGTMLGLAFRHQDEDDPAYLAFPSQPRIIAYRHLSDAATDKRYVRRINDDRLGVRQFAAIDAEIDKFYTTE